MSPGSLLGHLFCRAGEGLPVIRAVVQSPRAASDKEEEQAAVQRRAFQPRTRFPARRNARSFNSIDGQGIRARGSSQRPSGSFAFQSIRDPLGPVPTPGAAGLVRFFYSNRYLSSQLLPPSGGFGHLGTTVGREGNRSARHAMGTSSEAGKELKCDPTGADEIERCKADENPKQNSLGQGPPADLSKHRARNPAADEKKRCGQAPSTELE